jgi:putative membrane protein
MKGMLFRWLVLAIAVFITTKIKFLGITSDSFGSLLAAALVLGIANAFVKPVFMLISLPAIIFTLGLFIWIINAVLFYSLQYVVSGFHVSSFPSALGGALVVSLISMLFGVGGRRPPRNETRPRPPEGKGPVIDI